MDLAGMLERAYMLDNVDVDEAGRRVLVRAVPYGRASLVADASDEPARGRSTRPYREGWELGVFKRAARAPHRVPFVVGVAGGHEARRANPWSDVGRAASLDERDDGLYAELLVDRSPFGDATLAKIDSGQWRGISVGAVARTFRDEGDPHHGGVRWRTRADLDHILLTEQPAFPDAQVLEVREAPEVTRLEVWRAKYPRRAG